MTLSESIGADVSNYREVEANVVPNVGNPATTLEPGFNVFLRCPLPPVWQASPDSLRTFYQNGKVPQTRIFNPST